MIGDALALWELFEKRRDEFRIKSALFSPDGTRIEGDKELMVRTHTTSDERIWFYEILGPEKYVFVYMPVIPSVHLDYGTETNGHNPDAKFFRFVSNPLARFASGGDPNVKVNFMVFAYQPSDLLRIGESK